MEIFSPLLWEKPSSDELIQYIEKRANAKEVPSNGSVLVFRRHLSPLDVYKYLASRFGPPYGFQTFLKKPYDSDNLFHWDYVIKAGSNIIIIQGGNRDVMVQVDGKPMTPENWVQFAKSLKADFSRCSSGMAAVDKRLEKWRIVSNRFAMISDTCAGFHATLTEEFDAPDFTPPKRDTMEGIQQYYEKVQEAGQRASRIFSASFALDLITPVLAESFINLVIFLIRKNDLKNNKRQYDHYIRQPIDTRVFDLHLKCDHFICGVDPQSAEYKAFKKVMDRRNFNIHGNIDPGRDSIETIYFDEYTPLYEEGADPILELFNKKESIFDISGVISRYHDP